MTIAINPVSSSNISGCGYDPTTQEMHVVFTSGAKYAYYDVEPETYEGLLRASSPGSYFANNVKGQYGDTQI